MARKIPMRKCVVTQERHPKKDLIRVVLTPEKNVEVDLTGRKNGRGAYILKNKEVILKAQKTGALGSSLNTTIPEGIYDELHKLAEN